MTDHLLTAATADPPSGTTQHYNNLAIFLSAFELMKTGRNKEYHVTLPQNSCSSSKDTHRYARAGEMSLSGRLIDLI